MARTSVYSATGIDPLVVGDIAAYLNRHQQKSLLRFIPRGSVDDGKSKLIGRLLYHSKLILDDQLPELAADSRRVGARGQELVFALLIDGLGREAVLQTILGLGPRFSRQTTAGALRLPVTLRTPMPLWPPIPAWPGRFELRPLRIDDARIAQLEVVKRLTGAIDLVVVHPVREAQ